MVTLDMKPGFNYFIIPSTFKPDQEGNFLLRFVSEKLVTPWNCDSHEILCDVLQ